MAVKIKSLNTNNLRNDANMQFHFDVAALIIEFAAARLGIAALFDVYQAAVAHQDDVFKKIVKSKYTEKIEAADHARDKVYSNVTATIRMLLNHHNPEIVDIAKEIKIMLDSFGKVNQKSYKEQTSAIYNILQKFRGEYAADVETIRIPELVDELERTNKAVDALITERDIEAAAKNHDNMKAVRAETDKAYYAIAERINALVVVEGEENYADFITRLNLIIDRYKLLITKSHHHAKPKAEEPAELEEK